MIVPKAVTTKSLSAADTGELLRMRLSGESALVIVLRPITAPGGLLGILQMAGATAPSRMPATSNTSCVSFGTNWVLEPIIGPETFPGNRRFIDAPGAIHLNMDSIVITLPAINSPGPFESLDIDLNTFEPISLEGSAAPCASWQIWQSIEDRSDQRAQPLFEFTAQPTV